jgi:FixJ family two-component response regulator
MSGNRQPGALVYVVDDDAAVRRGIARLLRASGRTCREFESAKDYLAVPLEPCDAVCLVLDIRMPEMSGTELQTLVRGTAHDVPIIFVTGHGDIPTCVRSLKAGAVSFLPKPFDEAELLAAIAEALERSVEQKKCRERDAEVLVRFQRLSRREREVFGGVICGDLNKTIAHKMGIAEKTVKVHRGRVMAKMEVNSVADLVRQAAWLERLTECAAKGGL